MEKEEINKKLRVLKDPYDKIRYLKRVLPKTKDETRSAGYELMGDLIVNNYSGKVARSMTLSEAQDAYLKSGNKEKMIEGLKKIVKLNSFFSLEVGNVLSKLGERELAKEMYQKAYRRGTSYGNTFTDNKIGYFKTALEAAIKAKMPVEETTKLRKKIAELKRGNQRTQSIEKSKLTKILEKVLSVIASVFLLAGLIFMTLPEFTTKTTGNIIGSSAGVNIPFFLSIALIIIGGILLYKVLIKNNS